MSLMQVARMLAGEQQKAPLFFGREQVEGGCTMKIAMVQRACNQLEEYSPDASFRVSHFLPSYAREPLCIL